MTQITQHQIEAAMQQAHIERAKAYQAGQIMIGNWVKTSIAKISTGISTILRPTSHV